MLIPEEGKEVSRYIYVLNRHLARTSSFGRLQTTKSGKIQKEAHFSQDTILPLAGVYPRPSCTSAIGPPGVNFIVEVGLFGVRLPMVNAKPGAKMSYLHLLPGDAMPTHVRWREVVGKPLPAGGWYLAKSALLFGFFHFSSFPVVQMRTSGPDVGLVHECT